jgi:transposase
MARPTKLTPELLDRITLAIRAGNYAKTACEMVGIGETTFYRWMEEGEKDTGKKEFREFRESIKRAEAEAEVRSVALIRQAADGGTWQAAAWYLERKHGDRWGRNDKIRQEVTGANGAPVSISLEEAKKAVLAFLDEGANDTITTGTDTEQDTGTTPTMA